MQEGNSRPAAVFHKETMLRKMSLGHNGSRRDDGLHSVVLQKQDSAGDTLYECDSQEPSKDTLVHARKSLYKCKKCGKYLASASLFSITLEMKAYKCQECGKAFHEKL